MNHRPFEDWLLSGEALSAAQKRDLRNHLNVCDYCAALVEVNTALNTARPAVPDRGFVTRFEARLQAKHAQQRRRTSWGVFFLLLASAGMILIFALRVLPYFQHSPLDMAIGWVPTLISLSNSANVIGGIAEVLIRIAAGFVPAYAWVLTAVLFAFLGWLWVVSISRFSRLPQGA